MLKKLISLIFLVVLVTILIVSCTDEITKASAKGRNIRIEYSDCVSCGKCIDEFQCPSNAIIWDDLRGKPIIDL